MTTEKKAGHAKGPVADAQILLVYERSSDAYATRVNDVLAEGGWRIASSHAYPCDSDFFAMLVKSAEDPAKLREQRNKLLEALKQAVDQLAKDFEPTALDGMGALIRKLGAAISKAERGE